MMTFASFLLTISMLMASSHTISAFVPSPTNCNIRHTSRIHYRDDTGVDGVEQPIIAKKKQKPVSSSWKTIVERSEAASPSPKLSPIEKPQQDTTTSAAPSNFQSRMKNLVVQQRKKKNSISSYRPSNIQNVISLEDFSNVIEKGRDENKVVVVRFIASWCKTCKFLRPHFDKAASSNPSVIFVEVPVLENNSNLHQGLGVESVPFGHIYHPTKGLVEETTLSRKTFGAFVDLIKLHCSSLLKP